MKMFFFFFFFFFRNIEVFQLSCSCRCMNENPLFQVPFDNVCEGRTGADLIVPYP